MKADMNTRPNHTARTRTILAATTTMCALAGLAFGVPPAADAEPGCVMPVTRCGAVPPVDQPVTQPNDHESQRPVVEIVFVLDTTGSMGGLIEGAKQKIWSIASAVAGAQPAPIVKMGLIGYRDRSDQYVTRTTDLTDDLDLIYTNLMAFRAQGGGDTPESVNEALYKSIERIEWSSDPDALRIVYLVGDAPPHMDYEDDVKYRATCALAADRGILINTIQCGNLSGTEPVWREIAQYASGSYARVEQSGGAVVIATPYDDEIARLNTDLMSTMLDYGDIRARRAQFAMRDRADDIDEAAAPEAKASRAIYNQTAAGEKNLVGSSELIYDIDNGVVTLSVVKEEHLPERLKGLDREAQLALIDKLRAKRNALSAQIRELGEKRAQHIRDHKAAAGKQDGFDRKMLESLREQAKEKGIELGA